jgi:protein KTI12
MALVVMCGTPASGKTTRALDLKNYLQTKHQKNVILVNEEALKLDKN